MVTKIIETKAKPIPIQFFEEITSLKRNKPIKQDMATIATLFMVNTEELSKPSTRNAFNKKYIEL